MASDRCAVDHLVLPIVAQPKLDQCFKQCIENALITPASETSEYRIPVTVFCRQVTPGGPGAQSKHHPVEKPPIVIRWTAAATTL
jgi:hypothetical protein